MTPTTTPHVLYCTVRTGHHHVPSCTHDVSNENISVMQYQGVLCDESISSLQRNACILKFWQEAILNFVLVTFKQQHNISLCLLRFIQHCNSYCTVVHILSILHHFKLETW